MTEQERKDIQEALEDFEFSQQGIEADVEYGFCDRLNAARFTRIYAIAIRALRRWLDEDREDREHDEA